MTDQTEPSKSIRSTGAVDVKMLELLVCPLSYGPLKYDARTEELVSPRAKLAYPVRDGIPIMLVSEARHLADGE